MSRYRIVRRQYGVSEDWLYPQKAIFSLFGIINIWMDINSEGKMFSLYTFRFWQNDEDKAIDFINRLQENKTTVIYESNK